MPDQALDRPGRRIAQRADGVAFDLAGDLVQRVDFVRFGALSGRLQKIAPDARRIDPAAEPVYAVTVVADDERDLSEPRRRIQPGMLVDVEIEVGKRTVLAYLTDRLRRIGDEAFSEL